MENMNIAQNAAVNITASFAADAQPEHTLPITDKTTLGELLTLLCLEAGQKKPNKTPTPKNLRISAVPVAKMLDCIVYDNGFAYYNNGSRHSVLWLPYCVNFTYYFYPLRDVEKNTLSETFPLPEGLLESTAWPIVVTLIAEHRIEHHMDTNAGIGHAEVKEVPEEEDEPDIEGRDNRCFEFMWHEEPINVNPLDAVCRKETKEEILAELTDKQREVFIRHYRDGYTQQKIAEMLGISKAAVSMRLKEARETAKIILKTF